MLADWQHCIASRAPHSAFTDLCKFNQTLYCCFREATDHISGDGNIRILQLDWQGKVIASSRIHIPGADLRDPKLSVTAENKLILLAYGRFRSAQKSNPYSQPFSWFSTDGQSWSAPKKLADKNWWLWRLRWHQNRAFGVAYNRAEQRTALYAGDPRRTFECIERDLFSKDTHAKGYPNETDMTFTPDGTMSILLRRDADSCTAQLGMARPPYRRWHWTDLGVYIGGPAMLAVDQQTSLVSGRVWTQQGPKTALLKLDMISKDIQLVEILPSAGDNSYPGMVEHENALYLSYYSSHQHQKSCVYLCCYHDIRALTG